MNKNYLEKADKNLPAFISKAIIPDVKTLILDKGDSTTIDLKNHYVGYFSFDMNYVDIYIDAPVRMCIKFCETEQELLDDFSQYQEGLCTSWLQEEIINIDFPGVYEMPRRYAARYIQIKILNTPKPLSLSLFKFTAVTTADSSSLKSVQMEDPAFAQIDKIAVHTLKNCMQRVFEDGPKRDRRLWIGDLRLEALTNYYTFNNLSLVRRCLYLFAAAERNEHGFIPSFVYEYPGFVSGECFLEDYSLLFVASACDYYLHTKDETTFLDLYESIKSQMDAMYAILDDDGIMTLQESGGAFIDWCEGLCKVTSLHGVYLYVLNILTEVLDKLRHDDQKLYKKRYQEALCAAKKVLYDEEKNLVMNEKDQHQYSVHSVVWMILGGVLSGEAAKTALRDALDSEKSIKPFTPYMHHYVIEAMIKLDMMNEAEAYIKELWGGMISRGADTFFEVYVPGDPAFSPYGDRMINSMCHAWSCTPSYFIRKYFL